MANKPNEELDLQLANDESEMRYPILKKQAVEQTAETPFSPPEFIHPDKDKLVKIVRAYNNSDPQVTLENQGYIYIVSGLLEYFGQNEVAVYNFFMKIMFEFNWR